MQLTINSVEQKTGKKGPYYSIETDHGKFSSGEDVRPYIGKSADFNTAVSTDGKYNYINKPLPEIPKESVSNGAASDKERCMVLSYSKDLSVALINSGMLTDARFKDTTLEDAVAIMTINIFDKLWSEFNKEEESPF